MDSKIFVHELLSVYILYAKYKDFNQELLTSEEGHVVLKVSGKDTWEAFSNETGKHCVQRIGPTEAKGRKHTSFVSVVVLPLPEEKALKSIPINELEITATKGHGAGGQHRNVTQSAIRIVHPRTGLSVFIQNERDQHSNRRRAIRIITARVNEFDQSQQDVENNINRKTLSQGGRSDSNKIRTYNFLKGFAVDHRTGKKTNIKSFMKGNLELLL